MSKDIRFFKDIKIGELFYCWGDLVFNYNYPKICLMVKTDNTSAGEIENEEYGTWISSYTFFLDNEEFGMFDPIDLKDKDVLSKYNNYIKNKNKLFKEKE